MILIDNCSIHRAKKVADYMKSANYVPLWNVPYSPQYNGIELVWASAKRKFRAKVLAIKTGQNPERRLSEIIDEALAELSTEEVMACSRHSREVLIKRREG